MNLRKTAFAVVILCQFAVLNVYADTCNNANVDGVKWYHDSAEKKALYYQGYSIATKKIKHEVKQEHLKLHTWGVILDADETVLDNSWKEYKDYNNYKFSNKYLVMAKSIATPGSVKFTNMIHKMGGYVSIVTNRDANIDGMVEATKKNLKEQGIYFDQILFANSKDKNSNDKNPRFKAVQSGVYGENLIYTNKTPAHKVIAYFGDNIQDFPKFTQKEMANASAEHFDKFGKEYFIFPNPMYGSWM